MGGIFLLKGDVGYCWLACSLLGLFLATVRYHSRCCY